MNFKPHFNADVIINAADDVFDDDMGTIEGLWSFATNSAGALGATCDGPWLPDDGYFPATSRHPAAQLGYANDDDGPNAWQTFDAAGEITVQVPNLAYDTLLLYATGAYETLLTVTLNYTTGDPDSFAGVAYPSWFDEAPTGFFNLIDGLDRARLDEGSFLCEDSNDPGIVGRGFPVDSTRTLDSFTLERTDADQGVLNVFGATAVLARTVYDYPMVEPQPSGASLFNADLVANGPPGGCPGLPSDSVHDSLYDGWHLPTANLAGCSSSHAGLPDDGFFAGSGSHPPFQLALSDLDAGLNARRSPPGQGNDVFEIDTTDVAVDQVHLFGAGGGGYSLLGVKLFYATGDPGVLPGGGILVDGTLDDPPSGGAYYLVDGMDVHKYFGGCCWSENAIADAALFGVPFPADPSRVLTKIEITVDDPSGEGRPQSTLGLFGASGVKNADFYLYMDDFETGGLTGWSQVAPAL